MDCIDCLDRYIETIDICKALLVVPTIEQAREVKAQLTERDYPCGFHLGDGNRFIILHRGQLDIVKNLTSNIEMINAIFIMNTDDMIDTVFKLREILDPRLKSYILSLS